MPEPLRPTPCAGTAPRVSGRHKVEPEDFVVEELALYEPCGEGEHVWLWIEKRGVTTWQAIERLARALRCDRRDAGYAGLKDAHAVTRQWLSFVPRGGVEVDGIAVDGVTVLRTTRHRNKLRVGHLRGNRFELLVRGVEPGGAEHVRQNLAELQRRGVPNWFGEQRFGWRGKNLDKGLALLRGGGAERLHRVRKPVQRLLVSAVQSEVFNRVLARRAADFDALRDGDVAWLHSNGAAFRADDALAERHRVANFELSPSGPLPGPKMLAPAGEPAAIEAEVMAELEIEHDAFGHAAGGGNAGARRPLRVPLRGVALAEAAEGLRLAFELDKGSFATAVLRELLADMPWVGAGAAVP